MFLQTGGGGKGIRPNQQQHHHQQQQQQQHHQSTTHSHSSHLQQPQQTVQQAQAPHQAATHSLHPHQAQQHHHHRHQQPHQTPSAFYSYQISQPGQSGHLQQQPQSNNAGQAPSPTNQPAGSNSTSLGGANAGNSSSTNLSRQHTSAGNSIQHYATHTPTPAGAILQQPSTTTFMTTTYLQQQYHPQSAAVMAAAAAAAQYNTAAGSAGHSPQTQNTNAAQTLYQTQQQQHQLHQTHHQATIHAHYYHPPAGASPTPPSHIHPHHAHAQQHQLRGILTTQTHQRQQAYLMPANAIFALPSGPLAQPPPRSSLLAAHQQSGASVAPVPVTPLLQTAASARNVAAAGGTTTYITPPFCQPPLPMGPTPLTQPPQMLATAAAMATPTIQTYGHMAAAVAAANASTSATSISTTENVKTRKYAIPIIHPITHENVMDPKPQKKSASVEVKPSVMEEEQQQKRSNQTTTELSKERATPKKVLPINKSSSKEKMDQQMQTDAIKDKSVMNKNLSFQQTAEAETGDTETASLTVEPRMTKKEASGNLYKEEETQEAGNTIAPLDGSDMHEGYWPSDEAEEEGQRLNVLVEETAVLENNALCNNIVKSSTSGLNLGDIRGKDNSLSAGKQDFKKPTQQQHIKEQEHADKGSLLQCTEAFKLGCSVLTTANTFPIQAPTETYSKDKTNKIGSTEEAHQKHDTKSSSQPLQKSSKPNQQNALVIETITTSASASNKTQTKEIKSTHTRATTINIMQKTALGGTSGAQSSTTLTLPTHVQDTASSLSQSQQPQQQKQKTNVTLLTAATATSTKSSTAPVGVASNFSTNSKKHRKVTKRTAAKENQKNREQQAAATVHSGSCNRSASSNCSNTLISTNDNNNNVHTIVTLANNILQMTDTNNTRLINIKLEQPENGSVVRKSGDIRTTVESSEEPDILELNENSNFNVPPTPRQSKITKRNLKCENLAEDTSSLFSRAATAASFPEKCTYLKTQDIFAQFLQPLNANAKAPEELQLQFLNSSASACEDEEEINARLYLQQEHEDAATKNLHFGDFDDEKKQHQLGTALNLLPKTNTSGEKGTDTIDSNFRNFATRCPVDSQKLLKNSGTTPKSRLPLQQEVSSPLKKFKYSLEELKALAKTSYARKPPLVQCQKGNCIAQLFVSRQAYHPVAQHHHGQNISALTLQQQLQQQYQHMDFTESLEFVAGKRRGGGQPKKHHEHTASTVATAGATGSGSGTSAAQPQRKMEIIRVHLSLKEEIKLSECENAWQPETLRNQSSLQQHIPTDSQEDVKAVLKKVRGILNKLTPDNFDVLLKTMSSILMNTQEKMQQVMLLIFEKTISEPNFAPTYAKFCKVLFHDIKAEKKSQFTGSLINRIQDEFESNVNDADAKKLKLQPLVDKLERCVNSKERLELQAELEDQEYQFRRRAWGTVRFIGEMYKLQSLSNDRVLTCVESLLRHGCEEKLEYMCKLLTTVGYLLESNVSNDKTDRSDFTRLNKIFRKIEEFVHKSASSRSGSRNWKGTQLKISSRVRFMMQDVIDLRARNWDQAPQRPSSGSTAAKQDEKTQNTGSISASYDKYATAGCTTNRLSFGSSNQNSARQTRQGGPAQGLGESNFFLQKSAKFTGQQQEQQQQKQVFDINKLKFSRGDDNTQNNTTLGNSSIYLWRTAGKPSSAASMSTNTPPFPMNSMANAGTRRQANQFHALDKPDKLDHDMILSGNQSAENLSASLLNARGNLTPKECQKLFNRLIEEVLDTSSNSWQAEALNTWQSINAIQKVSLLHYLFVDYLHLATVKRLQRQACAKLFAYLMDDPSFDKERVFAKAYSQFGEEFPDVLVDVPNGWAYAFEFLGPLMHLHLLKFSDVWLSEWAENASFTEKFLKAFINYFTQEFGANYAFELWHKKYRLEQGECFFVAPGSAEKCRHFLAVNKLDHINDRNVKVDENALKRQNVVEQVKRIEYLINTTNDYNLALDYINTNVYINENFIRSLTKFFCCDYATKLTTTGESYTKASLATSTTEGLVHLNVELFREKCVPLLRFCLDTNEDLEISCLDEVVDSLLQCYDRDKRLAHELICTIFEVLYDCEIIPKESFEKWYRTHNASVDSYGMGAAASEASASSSEAATTQMYSRQLNQQQQPQHQHLSKKIDLFMTKIL